MHNMAEKHERRYAEYVAYLIVTVMAVGLLMSIWFAVSSPSAF